jgi:DNA anti-recombination protein RmuC
MSPFSQWKTIGYAAAIFATGAISGGALGVYEAKSHLFEPQRKQEIALHIMKRLQTRLNLTPDQSAKIQPIVDNVATELGSIHADVAQRVNKIFDDSYAQVSAILTPDQRKELDKMEKERRDMMQAHWQENHHHPGGPDNDQSPHGSPAAPSASGAPTSASFACPTAGPST